MPANSDAHPTAKATALSLEANLPVTSSASTDLPSDTISGKSTAERSATLTQASDQAEDTAAQRKSKNPGQNQNLTPEQRNNLRLQQSLEKVCQTIISPQQSQLIQTVRSGDRQLTLNVSSNWYGLTIEQQNDLAAALAEQSKTSGFHRLHMLDQSGKLVARSPVVGEQMVILRR